MEILIIFDPKIGKAPDFGARFDQLPDELSEDILELNPPPCLRILRKQEGGLTQLTSKIHYPFSDLAKTRGGG